MDGKIEVGYNHQYLLFEKGMAKADDLSKQLVRKKSMKKKLTTFSDGLFEASNVAENRFHFPVKLEPDQLIIGAYELAFSKES